MKRHKRRYHTDAEYRRQQNELSRARYRAVKRLITRHPAEWRELYREEVYGS